jgi:hypothetical protein
MAITFAQFDNIFREVYLPAIRQQLDTQERLFRRLMEEDGPVTVKCDNPYKLGVVTAVDAGNWLHFVEEED